MRSLVTDRLSTISLVLGIGGLAVAAYLTLVHYRSNLLVCTSGGCHTVQNSPYAEIRGFPVAALGLAMYIVLTAMIGFRRSHPESDQTLTMAIFGLALIGAVFTIYLTYLELFVIHAICQWCVAFAIITWALVVVEGVRLWRSPQPSFDFDGEEDDIELAS